MSDNMVTKKEWEEFRETGLFLIINQLLHVFGWSLIMDIDADGKITNVFPARVKFRGFVEDAQTDAYRKVSKYLKSNINEIEREINE